MRLRASRTRAAVLLLAIAPSWLGCWSFQAGPKDFEFAGAVSRNADATAILRVNEAGIPWGNGEFGPAIQEELLSRGIFSQVYYPVEPIDPPSTVIEVVGLGDFDEAVLWAMIASAATGYFFFLPAPVLPYFQDYEAEFEVRVIRADQPVQSFRVESSALVVHAVFARPINYLPKVRTSVVENLTQKVAAGIEGRGPY